MGVLGESSVVLIPTVNRPFGSVTPAFSVNSFRQSPPERIGIQGEYDYDGLAKRVIHAFRQAVGDEVAQLKVRQRGCVVILTGIVSSRQRLNQLINLAAKTEGAALVELYGVVIMEDGATA